MDNIAHTLVGVALGEAGLKKRSGFGMAALAIGANLPDLDVLAIPFGANLTFRRGWTHGPVAWLVLPFALTAVLVAWDRVQARHGRRPSRRAPVRAGPLLLLALIGVLSHPALDWLNSYGIRLLMPFSERWFYGDSIFIVDPWIWLVLATGVWLARRAPRRGAAGDAWAGEAREGDARGGDARGGDAFAAGALLLVAAYIGAMIGGTTAARRMVHDHAMQAEGIAPRRMVAGPVPLVPWRRELILDMGDRYRTGSLDFLAPPAVSLDPGWVMKEDGAAVEAARTRRDVRDFLYWSRFPVFTVEPRGDSALVTVGDMRFRRRGAGSFRVQVVVPR
jgi:inner membrane protein